MYIEATTQPVLVPENHILSYANSMADGAQLTAISPKEDPTFRRDLRAKYRGLQLETTSAFVTASDLKTQLSKGVVDFCLL